MIGHYSRHVGPQFDRGNCSRPRFFRGYRRPAFFYARPGSHRLGSRGHQPTAEQQAIRSTAAEVARLFVIAARAAHGNAEQQGQLRAFLERSRTELSEFIYGSSQHPQQANTENAPEVEA
ncbi:MAG TPA: hypothetical protein VF043_19290 [Ktedonobacteraceae bacterium]